MIQKVSPSRPYATGFRRGRPVLRPVVSSNAHHGTNPATRVVMGLTKYLASAVVSCRLSTVVTRVVARTSWDPRGTRARSWRAERRGNRRGTCDPWSRTAPRWDGLRFGRHRRRPAYPKPLQPKREMGIGSTERGGRRRAEFQTFPRNSPVRCRTAPVGGP